METPRHLRGVSSRPSTKCQPLAIIYNWMSATLTSFLGIFMKLGFVAFICNEVRGVILAVPVLYAMYQSGGSAMAIWLGFCSLAGIALSVIVPIIAAKKVQRMVEKKQAKAQPVIA